MPSTDSIYVFSDLDDSLFQTRAKCPQPGPLSQAAVDRHGAPLSYSTGPQRLLLTLLQQATLIPVTGRNTAALERVQLAFCSYRITSHGAMVLDPEGQPLADWLTLIGAYQGPWRASMEAAVVWVEQRIAAERLPLRCRLIEDQGVLVYVSIKGDAAALAQLASEIPGVWQAEPAQIHRNGHNMALLPGFASKQRAVSFVMERLRETHPCPLFLGIGDSLSDLPFMRLCHYAITPQGSQIQTTTWPSSPPLPGEGPDGR